MSVNLLYGAPHTGKSSLMALIAELFLKANPGKVVRLVTAETFVAYKKLIQAGQMEVFKMFQRQAPWETMMYATQGYWPVEPDNPKSKLAPPPPDLKDKVCLYIFEGCATFGELMLGAAVQGGLAARIARGEIVGNVTKEVIQFQDGTTKHGFNSGIQFGAVQRRVEDYVEASKSLAIPTWWTSHENDGEDMRGKRIIGPAIVGGAAVARLPKRFDWVLYTRVMPDKNNRPEYRVYLKPYFEVLTDTTWDGKQHTDRVLVQVTLREDIDTTDTPDFIVMNKEGMDKFFTLVNQNNNNNNNFQ